MQEWTPAQFVAEGSVNTVNGPVSYRAVSEDYVFYDETGTPEASVFSYSYFRTDTAEQNRPVVFCFNGGPGSSSAWIHTGVFGPMIMKYGDAVHPPVNPPYEMEENRHWILDVTDLVLIDPVGTGYGRLLQKEKAAKYYSAMGDATAIADFIEDWLRKFNRRNSPVYVCGESYGTVRASLLIQELMGGPVAATGKMRGIAVKGALLMGTVLDIGAKPLPVAKEPMDLYTQAAVAWYHRPEGKKTLREHLEDAWKFGTDEYLSALYLKNSLSAEQQQKTAQKLSYFTDIDAAYYLEHDLRISLEDFAKEIGKKRGFDVGMYDGRYTMPHKMTDGSFMPDPVTDDPAMGAYTPSMTGAMESILKEKLNITFARDYRFIGFMEINANWDYSYRTNPQTCLEMAARRNPQFRLYLFAGLYDLVTTAGYARTLENQIAIAADRIVRREYESGHMPYMGKESLEALTKDLRRFIGEKN